MRRGMSPDSLIQDQLHKMDTGHALIQRTWLAWPGQAGVSFIIVLSPLSSCQQCLLSRVMCRHMNTDKTWYPRADGDFDGFPPPNISIMT